MTTESNQSPGASADDAPGEPLRLTLGDQAYEVPAERIGYLHAALVAADKSCTAAGRAAHTQPPEGVTSNAASTPHYVAADVAGDLAHWIARRYGIASPVDDTAGVAC